MRARIRVERMGIGDIFWVLGVLTLWKSNRVISWQNKRSVMRQLWAAIQIRSIFKFLVPSIVPNMSGSDFVV